LSNLNKPVS